MEEEKPKGRSKTFAHKPKEKITNESSKKAKTSTSKSNVVKAQPQPPPVKQKPRPRVVVKSLPQSPPVKQKPQPRVVVKKKPKSKLVVKRFRSEDDNKEDESKNESEGGESEEESDKESESKDDSEEDESDDGEHDKESESKDKSKRGESEEGEGDKESDSGEESDDDKESENNDESSEGEGSEEEASVEVKSENVLKPKERTVKAQEKVFKPKKVLKLKKESVVKIEEKVSKKLKTVPASLFSTIHDARVDMKSFLEDIGFSSLHGVNIEKLPSHMAGFVVANFNRETYELSLEKGKILVTPEKIHEILGVPLGGTSFFELPERSIEDPFVQLWLKQFYPKKYNKIRASDVAGKLITATQVDFMFKVNFLTLFANVMARAHTMKALVDLTIVRRISEDTIIANIDLCDYIYHCLKYSEIPNMPSGFYNGALCFLILLYFDSIKFEGLPIIRCRPAIQNRNSSLMNQRQKLEIEREEIDDGSNDRGKKYDDGAKKDVGVDKVVSENVDVASKYVGAKKDGDNVEEKIIEPDEFLNWPRVVQPVNTDFPQTPERVVTRSSPKKRIIKPSSYLSSPYENKPTKVIALLKRIEFELGNSLFAMQEAMVQATIGKGEQWDIFSAEISAHLKNVDASKFHAEIELAFFPIQVSGHFYVVVFNIKKSVTSMIILDNSPQSYAANYKDACDLLKEFFARFLLEHTHPKSDNVMNVRGRVLHPKWKTNNNHVDCGVFAMIHMESYVGETVKNWDVGLCQESDMQVSLLRRMRFKIATKILLHELNLHSPKMYDLAFKFQEIHEQTRISIIVNAIKNRADRDPEKVVHKDVLKPDK
ncbi:hypothetical protein CTI12_AA556140 [Artemisia annua]|uniref:Ubiquitin-like protease family profile domain-containing protein n=1 Tax=Artemisia annua TaxID=35608 RepID=A0A2U1KWL7_ARTAN|nr:hypothetical protein CTI12_AA556140 [Artemisia annua]